MRTPRITSVLAASVVCLVLVCGGTAHAQRGRPGRGVEIPIEIPIEIPRIPGSEPLKSGEPLESVKGESRKSEPLGSPFSRFGEIFERTRKPTAWERAGSESPREEARFRVPHASRLSSISRGSLDPSAAVILPKGEAFRDVFGHTPGRAETERMGIYEKRFRESNVEILGESGMGAEELRDWIHTRARTGNRPVVVIGHSKQVNGKEMLVLPEGMVEITRIHEWAAEKGSECVVITCYGSDIGLTSRIRFDDVLAVWTGVIHAMKTGASSTATSSSTAERASSAQVDELTKFVCDISQARLEYGGRSMQLTFSAPASRPLPGVAPSTNAGDGAWTIWNLRMERPDRTLLIAFLIATALGLIHHAIYLAGVNPVGSRPVNNENFRLAIASFFQYLKTRRRAGVLTVAILCLLVTSVYLTGSELFMDWEERHWGDRWPVHTFALASASLACSAGGIYVSLPRRSLLWALSHAVGGIIVGVTTAWVGFVMFCSILGIMLGLVMAAFGIIAWLVDGSMGPVTGFLWGFGYPVVAGMFFGGFIAFFGLFVGCKAALDGKPVHKAVFTMLAEVWTSPETRPIRPLSGQSEGFLAKRVFKVGPEGDIHVESSRPTTST